MGSGIQDIVGNVNATKSLFGGSRDKDATNDMLDGKVVATGTPGATTVADPNQGLTAGQAQTRRVVSSLGKSLGSSLNRPQATPQGRPVQFTFADNQPSYSQPRQNSVIDPFFGLFDRGN
jgi:hypothetical protein